MGISGTISQTGSNKDLLVADTTEQAVFFDLVRAASRLEGDLNRVFRPYDLTTATFSILSILARVAPEGLSCGDIATQLIAEVPDMTRLLDRLERLEYVVRERSALDRRMVKVRLTERGIGVVAALREVVLECHKRQFRSLSPERLASFRELVREVARDSEREGMKPGLEGHAEHQKTGT